MQDNALQNNPLAFFVGLVLFFAGLLVALFYLIVRTATESTKTVFGDREYIVVSCELRGERNHREH